MSVDIYKCQLVYIKLYSVDMYKCQSAFIVIMYSICRSCIYKCSYTVAINLVFWYKRHPILYVYVVVVYAFAYVMHMPYTMH